MRVPALLCAATLLAGCSGGGSGGTPAVPSVPWGSFRHDTFNSAASGIIDRNKGDATLLAGVGAGAAVPKLPGVTLSTPAVDRGGDVIIGTTNGVIALDGNPHCSANPGQGCTGDSCAPDGGVCNSCPLPDAPCTCLRDGGSCNCGPDDCKGGIALRCSASQAPCANDGDCGPDGGTCECAPDDVPGICGCFPDGGTCSCLENQCLPGKALRCSGSGRACNADTCGSDQGTCTGSVRWTFDQFDPNECSKSCPSPQSSPCGPVGLRRVGSVSASPSVTAGDDIVFGTDGSDGGPARLFALREQGDTVECLWVYPRDGGSAGSGISSSAITQVYNLDLSLTTAIVGDEDGRLRAFNFDGSVRWTFPRSGALPPITSSPANDLAGNTYVTTADGVLSVVNATGTPTFRFSMGIAPAAALYPSPAVTTTVYAVGTGGSLFAITPSNSQTPKWQFDGAQGPISGSPAFLSQTFPAQASNTLDTIAYVIDQNGRAYGVRDSNGALIPIQRCAMTTRPGQIPDSCRTDSCLPFGQICNTSTARCSGGALPNQHCSEDSCANNLGPCVVREGTVLVPDVESEITTSPIVSADQFVVIGTSDGRVCARSLANLVPGDDVDNSTAAWEATGCIALGNGGATRSSASIGPNGEIYVTTDAGLYIIK